MEVLDTTIANVALRYIAGGLSAAVIDSEWVITSYLAANATILPISGWLSARLGRRNYFMMSIAVFTISSGLCGIATSLNQLILFRVLQGLAGGGLQPSSQAVLLDAFPREKQGAAMTMFGVAALLAPVVGPTLGGYLTDNYNWRWIFYINLPVGPLALVACYFLLDDPDYLKAERAELLQEAVQFRLHRFRAVGAHDVVVGDHAQQGATVGLAGRPVLARADAADRIRRRPDLSDHSRNADQQSGRQFPTAERTQFRRVLHHHLLRLCRSLRPEHVASRALATLFGYDAYHSGLVLSPSGIASIVVLLVVGTIAGPRSRCTLVHRSGTCHGRDRQLLDVAHESARSAPGRSSGRGAC